MMKTEIQPYFRSMNTENLKKKAEKTGVSLLTKENLILLPLGFLLGRASIFGSVMPFGFPFYAATINSGLNRIVLAISVILGMITGGIGEQVYITISAMVLFNAFNLLFKNKKKNLNLRYALIGFAGILIPGLLTTYLQGFLLYDVLKNFLQGFIAFVLVFVFRSAVPVIYDLKDKYSLTNEEMVSVAIISALAIAGLGNIRVLAFDIKDIIAVLIVLWFSYSCGSGIGSAVGVVMGLAVSISSSAPPFIIASYAFCGVLSGVLGKLGKVGPCIGFIMGNAIITLYINGSIEALINLKDIIISIVMFLVIPQRFVEIITGGFLRSFDKENVRKNYSTRIKEITIDRLNRFASAFKELSRTFGEISETKVVTDRQDITSLFDRVADKVCKDCSLCMHCWDRNFYNTYQVMFKIVERLDSKGRIEEKDIPDYFLERCERICDFVEEVNNIYEIFRVDMVWKSKLGESRSLVSQQLDGLSRVISNLASEISIDIHFRSDWEDAVLVELNKAGVRATEVIVYENKWKKYEVSVFHKGCGGRRICVSVIEKVVSEIVGRRMAKEISECSGTLKHGCCALKLVEEDTFRVTTGVAKMSKYDDTVSGDSYTFMNTGDGRYIIAISDGMGTGQRASVQSQATVSLLEQFMESGFDKDTAIKIINSILVLKSDDECFSTMDMTVIDLYEGDVEFVKVGAVPTYIIRDEGGCAEIIRSASLPAGLLCNIEVELIHKRVNSGDFIVMMTDGLVDSFKCANGEKDLIRLLGEIMSKNPQEIADTILQKAFENCEGRPVDDMMVVVAKVWKRI